MCFTNIFVIFFIFVVLIIIVVIIMVKGLLMIEIFFLFEIITIFMMFFTGMFIGRFRTRIKDTMLIFSNIGQFISCLFIYITRMIIVISVMIYETTISTACYNAVFIFFLFFFNIEIIIVIVRVGRRWWLRWYKFALILLIIVVVFVWEIGNNMGSVVIVMIVFVL